MPTCRGPLDDKIEKMVEILFRNRAKRKWWFKAKTADESKDAKEDTKSAAPSQSLDDRALYRAVVADIERFALTVGLFATNDVDLIYIVLDELEHGLIAYLGRRRCLLGPLWGLSMVCRGNNGRKSKKSITPSEQLFIEIREQLQVRAPEHTMNLEDEELSARELESRQNPTEKRRLKVSATKQTETPMQKLGRSQREGLDPKFRRLVFDTEFRSHACSVVRRGKWKKLDRPRLVGCFFGCDLLLLRELGFKDPLMERLTGFKSDTLADRVSDCINSVSRMRRLQTDPIQNTTPVSRQL